MSMSYSHRPKKKKSPIRGVMPIMGIMLAVLLGLVAFFLAPPIVDWAKADEGRIGEVVNDQLLKNLPGDTPEDRETILGYVLSIVIWLILFSFSMLIVAGMIGPDPEKMALKDMPAPPANKDAMIKQMKKDLKAAKRRESERKRR